MGSARANAVGSAARDGQRLSARQVAKGNEEICVSRLTQGRLDGQRLPARQGAVPRLQEVLIAVPGDVPGLTAVVYHRFEPGVRLGALNFGSRPGSTGSTEAVVERRGFRRG